MIRFATRDRRQWKILSFAMVLLLLSQPACFFRGHKPDPSQFPAAPLRVVLLPFNVPDGAADQQWMAFAAPIVMAEEIQSAPDLTAVPLWQSMPVAVQTVGSSRTVTAANAAYIASRISASWTIMGRIAPVEKGVALMIDFIPAKASLIPFRYEKRISVDKLAENFRKALDEFGTYVVSRPLEQQKMRLLEGDRLKEVARSLDHEYGWYEEAKPGEATGIVDTLAGRSDGLGRLLFNPTLYPSLETRTGAAQNKKLP